MSTFLKNNEGGIAIPFLCIMALFTITTLYFIDEYQQKQTVMKQMTDAYLADTLEEKSKDYARSMKPNDTLTVNYSIGKVHLDRGKFGSLVKMTIELNSGFKRRVFVNIE